MISCIPFKIEKFFFYNLAMFTLELFSAVISIVVFAPLPIAKYLSGLIAEQDRSTLFKLLIILCQAVFAFISLLTACYYVYTIYYIFIEDAKNRNKAILLDKKSCTVDVVQTIIDTGCNCIKYSVWYFYKNSPESYYTGICDIGLRCWPVTNDTITCWPVEVNTVTRYVTEPPLIDIEFYTKHFNWGIAQFILCTIIVCWIYISLISIIRNNIDELPIFLDPYIVNNEGVVNNRPVRQPVQPAPPVGPPPAQARAGRHMPIAVTIVKAASGPICSICLENQPVVMFANCKHVCLCELCAIAYNNDVCPICAQQSAEKVKIFYPAVI